jgi:hypothetical protein
MATTTTNYGFDIPQSTDLVKDGATAIATLGQDIDTAMNTALGTKKAGMVLLSSLTFSGVTSQSINDVFSATYDNYRFIMPITSLAGNATITMRLRVGGVDNSAANYTTETLLGLGAVASAVLNNNGTSFVMQSIDGSTDNFRYVAAFDIFQPFTTTRTLGLGTIGVTNPTNFFNASASLTHSTNTSFDGFTILSSVAISGTIQVFGYNK